MDDLILHERPEINQPRLVIGLSGWMDGGHVSTATLGFLRERLAAQHFAEIDPTDFYVFNFPAASLPISVYLEGGRPVVASLSPMGFTALFRPHARIKQGIVEEFAYPENDFWVAADSGLIKINPLDESP